jgi:hypothetical protein
LLGLMFNVVGCGPSTGSVSGVVRFMGEPVPGARVAMIAPDGRVVAEATTGEDGAYVSRAPVGPLKVTVDPPFTPDPRGKHFERIRPGRRSSPDSKRSAKPIAIPARYQDPNRSGLTCTISGGQQAYDIDLEP